MNWISVKDELPKIGQEVIIYSTKGGGVDLCVYGRYKFLGEKSEVEFQTTWTVPITHWIPKPEICQKKKK